MGVSRADRDARARRQDRRPPLRRAELEHTDGSAVVAKAVANAPGKGPDDIPWLKLEVTAQRGSGTLSGVTTVQRINTAGGVHTGACGTAGAFHSAPYAADYVFLRKGS